MGGRLNQPGYLSQIKSMLSELMQYQISEGELDEMIRLADQKPQLQYKLKDLRVLEEGFREYMQDRFITAEELLTRFCQAAPRSGMLKDCSMVFDGFTGFTPVQLSALETLLKLTPQIRISVTLGAGEPVTGQCGEHELFYLSRKTIGSLLRLARKTGTQVLDPVVLDGKGGRFRENDSLAFLEKELFRYGKRETWKGEKPAISIWAARNPMEEVRLAASLISRMTRERGIRFREIGVIAGDLSAYESYVRNIFAEYQIPCLWIRRCRSCLIPAWSLSGGLLPLRMKTFPIPVCSASCAPGSRALRSRKSTGWKIMCWLWESEGKSGGSRNGPGQQTGWIRQNRKPAAVSGTGLWRSCPPG